MSKKIFVISPVSRGEKLSWDDFHRKAEEEAARHGLRIAGEEELQACLQDPTLLQVANDIGVIVFLGTTFNRGRDTVVKNLYRDRIGWFEYCIVRGRPLHDHVHVACF
jgi:hypothetical protein